ncbi:MAG: hypothetical protein HYX34_03465 [Actinobacteria bacterium]|nr:hypothetical protein [Actinomycetota bacterium]
MTALERLLAVQEHDTRLDQLRHRLATLPERAALADLERRHAQQRAAGSEVAARHGELAREQKRLEDEIASLVDRAAAADRTLYSGTVSNPRELQALQDDIASIRRRIRTLEDQELELMEQLEPIEADMAKREQASAALLQEAELVRQRLTAAEAEISVAVSSELAARAEAAGQVGDDELLREYEAIRARLQGVGVARLVAGTCGGCHLRLPAVELDRLKHQPADAVPHCEECGRLLVV